MPRPDDLRELLSQLADRASDDPDMLVTRPRRPGPARRTTPALLVACLLAALLAVPLLGVDRSGPPSLTPAAPATEAVPATTGPASTAPTPAPTPSNTPGRIGPDAALAMRPMTSREVSARTAQCTAGRKDVQSPPRRGRLRVRYAMVQAAAGVPADSTPRTVLLLEDDLGRFDCSDPATPAVPGDVDRGFRGWYGEGGDSFPSDDTAGGHELPTVSGSSSTGPCLAEFPRGSARAESASSQLVLATSSDAQAARVTVTARGGSRVVTVPTRGGYVFVPVQVTGAAARRTWHARIELLDAGGDRLRIQRYAGSTTQRLDYSFRCS